jgi:hypothetical protein
VQWQWSGIWQAAATQGPDGWVAETRIRSRRYRSIQRVTWGLNLHRRVARTTRRWGGCRNRTQARYFGDHGANGAPAGFGLGYRAVVNGRGARSFSPRETFPIRSRRSSSTRSLRRSMQR